MQKAELLALAERVEALEGPNFAIEQEVGRMCNPQATKHSVFLPYTASLDAAMTLARGPAEAYHVFGEALSKASFYAGDVRDVLPRYALAAILRAKAGGL